MTNETNETVATTTKTTVRQRVSEEQFFQVWEAVRKEGGTIADVATKLNTKKASVQSRASQMRTRGIPLGKLARASGGGGKKITLQDSLAMLARIRGVALEEIVKESEAMRATK